MNERSELFQGGPQKPQRKWGVPQETEQTRDLSNEQLLQQQKQKIEEQDHVLDILGQSVARTKEIAYAIGNETDEHLALLDEIDGKVDRTTARVKNTTKRVERVERKSSSRIMWAVICLLILSLIVVSFLAIYT